MLHFVSEYEPSLIDEQVVPGIDLTAELIKHPNSTFLVRMTSNELITSGIFQNDLLVIDRSLPVHQNDLVLAYLNEDAVIRYYSRQVTGIRLSTDTHNPQRIQLLTLDDTFQLFGVVTSIIRQLHSDF